MDYFNDPELNGKYLGTITKDFVKVCDTLAEASSQIRKGDFSQYPIFVFAKQEVPLGGLLVNADELNLEWHVFASYLELFVQQGIIDEGGIEAFKATYKDADEFCCLFVLDEEFTNFVFVPYPED
ncbi:hypothetical protein GCM10028824_11850 [Hymenobacter segetis]|jgi:hypothetical protein|uniref:Uncharacterized protein n=2 Tax=Hymenobacter TaxID=89966 RepID=A0ABT9A6Z9_9BACT|nr:MULTISPECIES: hypothetical protein [unclassified Hymenobacter]MDO7845620.1 hypothetical protein [Hymenobacter sp. M29]MDO7851264.1 hypothetical protein [Hymenobacter sp. CA1UV-4]